MTQKETMGERVVRNLTPYQVLEGISDAELERRAGLEEGTLAFLRSRELREVSSHMVILLATYFGVAPEALTQGGRQKAQRHSTMRPSASTFIEQEYGLTNPQLVTVLEQLADSLAHAPIGLEIVPMGRKGRREFRAWLELWLELDPVQRELLLAIAQQFSRS